MVLQFLCYFLGFGILSYGFQILYIGYLKRVAIKYVRAFRLISKPFEVHEDGIVNVYFVTNRGYLHLELKEEVLSLPMVNFQITQIASLLSHRFNAKISPTNRLR